MVVCKALVFWCVFLVIQVCCAQDLSDIEGFSNDSPYIKPVEEKIRVKEGTTITLKCGNQYTNHTKWEYKECDMFYKGIDCSMKKNETWKKRSSRQRFEINSVEKNHSGQYRCIEKGIVKKSVIIEVVGSESYEGPPPSVQSLLTSNITGQLNMEFTIQCNITSIIPPTVIWFKKCFGSKCDIKYDDICYCHLNVEASSYNIGNTYISKMNIFNAKEIDSGLYACLAVNEYGKDYRYVTITVPNHEGTITSSSSLLLLFLVPLALVIVPILVWLCYFRRKKKMKPLVASAVPSPHHQQLLVKASGSRSTRTVV